MKAVGFSKPLPIEDSESLVEREVERPSPSGRDLLIQVHSVSVNPVDTKRRKGSVLQEGEFKILGWDAAGTVVEVGPDCALFQAGDEVWYAGSLIRSGSNAEYQLVDERIVGRKPKSLSFADAAALPLTSITAWELLFERFGVRPGKAKTDECLLIVGAAGGVGSILVQLARRLTSMQVIGTASRPETKAWVKDLGAHEVLDHSKPLSQELKRIGLAGVTHVASLTQTDQHFEQLIECLLPQGKFGLIDDPPSLDAMKLKRKSLSLHWELMFTRSLYETPDMIAQHELLNEMSELVDSGIIKTTLGEHFGEISAENLKRAHRVIEEGKARGKIVLSGF